MYWSQEHIFHVCCVIIGLSKDLTFQRPSFFKMTKNVSLTQEFLFETYLQNCQIF